MESKNDLALLARHHQGIICPLRIHRVLLIQIVLDILSLKTKSDGTDRAIYNIILPILNLYLLSGNVDIWGVEEAPILTGSD
jgi:hypothetical protein